MVGPGLEEGLALFAGLNVPKRAYLAIQLSRLGAESSLWRPDSTNTSRRLDWRNGSLDLDFHTVPANTVTWGTRSPESLTALLHGGPQGRLRSTDHRRQAAIDAMSRV